MAWLATPDGPRVDIDGPLKDEVLDRLDALGDDLGVLFRLRERPEQGTARTATRSSGLSRPSGQAYHHSLAPSAPRPWEIQLARYRGPCKGYARHADSDLPPPPERPLRPVQLPPPAPAPRPREEKTRTPAKDDPGKEELDDGGGGKDEAEDEGKSDKLTDDRRVTAILYLTPPDWEAKWGGSLRLFPPRPTRPVGEVAAPGRSTAMAAAPPLLHVASSKRAGRKEGGERGNGATPPLEVEPGTGPHRCCSTTATPPVTVLPLPGRLVVFLSHYEHQVMAVKRRGVERVALTRWFH